jgi:hypothetical protein
MGEVSDIATNPKYVWQHQTGSGGLYTKAGAPARLVVKDPATGGLPMVGKVPIRVVVEPAGKGIVRAHPMY